MEIRRARPDDASALARVHVDAWRVAYRGLVPDERLKQLTHKRSEERWRSWIHEGQADHYVADAEGGAIGFLTLGACRDEDLDPKTTGEIWGIYLHPSQWRKGYGTRLCQFGEGVLEARGFAVIAIWVFAGNAAARRFYETMGYQPDGASKILDVGAPLEAIRYRRALDASGGRSAASISTA